MKKISLNKNSWHYRYYSWVLCKDSTPKTLCPYFWTMVVLVLFLPVVLFIKLIGMLFNFFDKRHSEKLYKKLLDENYDYEKERAKSRKIDKVIEIIGKVVTGFILLCLVTLLGLALYTGVKEVGWLTALKNLFTLIGIITTFLLIVAGIAELEIGSKIVKSKFIQVPKAMIIAVYTKSCPLVDWK